VLVDVDLEALDRTGRDGGQRGVDALELLELDPLPFRRGRRRRHSGGASGRGRVLLGMLAAVPERAARRKQQSQQDAGHDRDDSEHQAGVSQAAAPALRSIEAVGRLLGRLAFLGVDQQHLEAPPGPVYGRGGAGRPGM
jgi:hypothetical protein